jgi:shikimate dehydrogenase
LKEIRKWGSCFPELQGFNVTIPFKQEIIQYLDVIDENAKQIGAVNCVKIQNGRWQGFNTDTIGFKISLLNFLNSCKKKMPINVLILGNGGSSKAVQNVLLDLKFKFSIVSRQKSVNTINYNDIDEKRINTFDLIVNTTSLGMFPNINLAPDLPYHALNSKQLLFDLIYNPDKTLFLNHGLLHGCHVTNGHEMLIAQAEASWEIWNS